MARKQHLATISGVFVDEALPGAAQELRERLVAGEKGITPFHWDLEFPEVFGDGRDGFDAFVGNPPFAGKNTIAEGSPDGILDWFKQLHPESHGNADLVTHFFRRCFDLLRPCGSLGLIATNTITQGDTRSTGLRWICLNGGTIYAARKRFKWPGVAAVVVSVVHLLKGAYAGAKLLERRPWSGSRLFCSPTAATTIPSNWRPMPARALWAATCWGWDSPLMTPALPTTTSQASPHQSPRWSG